jgi:anti-sigma regulatory factor (Ser/Thr protein kinase)
MTAQRVEERYQTPSEVIDGFQADAATVQRILEQMSALPSVESQLSGWGEQGPWSVRLRSDWREYVHMVAQHLDHRLDASGAGGEMRGHAHTAFAELVDNAFEHGCRGAKQGIVAITIDLNSAFLRLEVSDPGEGFNARKVLEEVRSEPLTRERRRGLLLVSQFADILEYSDKGNRVKCVVYCKSEGSGVQSVQRQGYLLVEVKGKGDLALNEEFRRWGEHHPIQPGERLCLAIHLDWVSSMFVGSIGKLQGRVDETGALLTVFVQQSGCYRAMEQLGITSFVRVFEDFDRAEKALLDATCPEPSAPSSCPSPPTESPHPTSTPSRRSSASGRLRGIRRKRGLNQWVDWLMSFLRWTPPSDRS